jgi:hypothetical protein
LAAMRKVYHRVRRVRRGFRKCHVQP